jgi:hypothetical protein
MGFCNLLTPRHAVDLSPTVVTWTYDTCIVQNLQKNIILRSC